MRGDGRQWSATPPRSARGAISRNRLVDDLVDPDRLLPQFNFAGFVAGNVERGVDDAEHMPAARDYVVDVVAIGSVPDGAEQFRVHDLRKADDGAERSAQLVAQLGEEYGFGGARRFGLRQFPPQSADHGATTVEVSALALDLDAHCAASFGRVVMLC